MQLRARFRKLLFSVATQQHFLNEGLKLRHAHEMVVIMVSSRASVLFVLCCCLNVSSYYIIIIIIYPLPHVDNESADNAAINTVTARPGQRTLRHTTTTPWL